MNILEYIPKGHDNGISLQELSILTGLKSRWVRREIEKSNLDITTPPIVNLMDGAGYFVPTKEETESIRRYVISEKSRARKIEKKIRSLEKYLANIGQEEMKFIG